jgi:hypothetical protein
MSHIDTVMCFIQGIRIIKLFAWEENFISKVKELRINEVIDSHYLVMTANLIYIICILVVEFIFLYFQ